MTTTAPAPGEDRAEWLDWRRQGIGASDVAGILGISPWSSPWKVWADKLGLLPDEDPTDAMEAGRWLELAIAPWFADRTGLTVGAHQLRLESREWPTARATLDGLVFDGEGWHSVTPDTPAVEVALGGLEVKHEAFGRKWEAIPDHYQAQAQWQMYVAGLDRVWFAVLRGRRLDVHELARDSIDIDYMVGRVREWWERHVVTGTPPPVDASPATRDALVAAYPQQDPGATVPIDRDLFERWKAAKAASKAADDESLRLGNEVRAALGDAEAGSIDGQIVVTWKAETRTSFDRDRFRETHPRIARRFESEASTRVLREKKTDTTTPRRSTTA